MIDKNYARNEIIPNYQGRLDGLCGPYAIVNAFDECGFHNNNQIFQCSCEAISRQRWPKILWDGTTFGDMQRMIKACLNQVNGLGVQYPFMRNTPLYNEEYWQKFDEIFADENSVCGIIGLTKPFMHWSVVSKDGGRILFTDSTVGEPYARRNRSTLYAGFRRKKSTHWLINRKELIVFCRT